MAKMKGNVVMHGVTGTFGDEIVIKNRKGQQYISRLPTTDHIIPTDNQTLNRESFADAVTYAKWIREHPDVEIPFQIKPNQTRYQAAISYFRRTNKTQPSNHSKKRYTIKALKEMNFTERQIGVIMYTQKNGTLTNGICRALLGISKPSASRFLKQLVDLNIIRSSGVKGVGSKYQLIPL
jgi:hypothetical protein